MHAVRLDFFCKVVVLDYFKRYRKLEYCLILLDLEFDRKILDRGSIVASRATHLLSRQESSPNRSPLKLYEAFLASGLISS
jgi:hypothetical protein